MAETDRNPAQQRTDRNTAQQRADRIRAFEEELAVLRTAGALTLSPEQEKAMREHHETLLKEYAQVYDVDRSAETKQLSAGMRAFSFVGALALCASVYFLYYRFWGHLPTPAQVAMLLGAAFGSLAITVWLGERGGSPYFTKLAALIAVACFVLDLGVLGQIFGITPSDRAFVAWGALALLLAYRYDSQLLLFLGLAWLAAFVTTRTAALTGVYWQEALHRNENLFPAGMLLLAAPAVPALQRRQSEMFSAVYRVAGMVILFVAVLAMATTGSDSYLPFGSNTIQGIYQIVGFVGAAAAVWVGVRRRWTHLINTGVVCFVILLAFKFYDWWWDSMPKWLFFLVVGLASVLLLLVLGRLRREVIAPPTESPTAPTAPVAP